MNTPAPRPSRRRLLSGLSASVALVPAATTAAPVADADLLAMVADYHREDEASARAFDANWELRMDGTMSDEAFEATCYRWREWSDRQRQRIAATPARSPAGVAAKLTVFEGWLLELLHDDELAACLWRGALRDLGALR